MTRPLKSGRWYRLKVHIEDRQLTAFIDDEPVMTYAADRSLAGYVGLWTKADSVVWFDDFKLETKQAFSDLFGDLRSQAL